MVDERTKELDLGIPSAGGQGLKDRPSEPAREIKRIGSEVKANEPVAKEIQELSRLILGDIDDPQQLLSRLNSLFGEFQFSETLAIAELLKILASQDDGRNLIRALQELRESFRSLQIIQPGAEIEFNNNKWKIDKPLGEPGAMGAAYLGHLIDDPTVQVVFKTSKMPDYLLGEANGLLMVNDIQEDMGLERDKLLTPRFLGQGGRKDGLAQEFLLMAYAPGVDAQELAGEIEIGKRAPLSEEQVFSIYKQVSYLGSIIEKASKQPLGEKRAGYVVTMAKDPKPNRIKIDFSSVEPKVQVIDWSLNNCKTADLPKTTQEALQTIGYTMIRLLGGKEGKILDNVSTTMRLLLERCLGTGEDGKIFQTFKELHQSISFSQEWTAKKTKI